MTRTSSESLAKLCRLSTEKAIDPLVGIDLATAPARDKPWMSEELVSLHGTPYYDALDDGQRLKLSQLEFSLFCSILGNGEREVIANVVKLMLKRRFEPYRRYIFHFLREENNHIYMFSEFCHLHGQFFPIVYPYAKGEIWKDEALADVVTFVHVLAFEELNQGLNEVMMRDPALPELVRGINRYHVLDESRHISFGRTLISELAPAILATQPEEVRADLRRHIMRQIATRHIDYHNLPIYRMVGVPDAVKVREELISARGVGYFMRSPRAEKRVRSMLDFLRDVGLIDEQPEQRRDVVIDDAPQLD